MFKNNCHFFCIKLYISITTSISLVWSISLLFLSLMQSVNVAKFLNITFLFLLSANAAVHMFVTIIVPLTSM